MAIARLLVANRGEIALRVFRTCSALGIETVAVAAPDDAASLHARSADQVVEVAGYLHLEEHVRAARAAGADAVHPGYGFLAESADFAAAVEAAGLTWVGPSPEALRLGGDKLAAKRIAREAGVPVLPDGTAAEVGLPLLVKAAAGGGGRGMRVVRDAAELDEALAAAEREAAGAFGDGTLYLERYLERPRHVEVQLLADAHDNVVALGERDCSVQRRHQKVLEEAPAPELDGCAARCNARGCSRLRARDRLPERRDRGVRRRGRRVLLPRAQRAHPGRASGDRGGDGPRPRRGAAPNRRRRGGSPSTPPPPDGHAVEVRLYAEDPRTFLPQAGRVERLRLPDGTNGVRVDTGVEEGDEIGLAYDPMIAKLIAHGRDRSHALDLLASALDETEIGGVTTNLPFLRWLVAHPVVRAGEATTAFLAEHVPLAPASIVRAPTPWRVPWRLNLPAPPPALPPDIDDASHRHGAAHAGSSTVTAPMPGTVIRVEVAVGDEVGGPPAARRRSRR